MTLHISAMLPLLITSIVLPLHLSKVIQQDVDAINDFYYATNGLNWTLMQWNINQINNGIVCNLTGIICNLIETRVTRIGIARNGLTGTLPSSIGNLTELKLINLKENSLSGSIPSSICQLSHVKTLDLSRNHISGSVPASIGKMSSLEVLDLDNNNLSGSIPESIAQLQSLIVVEMMENHLTGSIPYNIGALYQLESFLFHSNHLSGTIPESISNMTQLKEIDLGKNELSGTIPSSMGNLLELESIYLSVNELSGAIPDSFLNLTNLNILEINNNDLSSDHFGEFLLAWLGTNSTYRNSFRFHINNNPKISGDLSVLERLGPINISIAEFLAYNCSLKGSMPKNVFFRRVNTFWVWDNQLSCELPPNLVHAVNSKHISASTTFLMSNLFKIRDMPAYLSSYSPFYTASLLYYTETDEIISYIVAIFAITVILLFMSTAIKNKVTRSKESDKFILLGFYYNALRLFVDNLEFIKNSMNNIILLLISVCLSVFYYENSNYFKCSPILSQLSIAYFQPVNEYCDWILVIVILPGTYIILWFVIINAQVEQLNQSEKLRKSIKAELDVEQTRIGDEQIRCNVISKILWFLFYLSLFAAATSVVIVSLIFETLPENNSFGFSSSSMRVVAYSMAIILTINASLIIPNLSDHCFLCIRLCISSVSDKIYLTKYRPMIIAGLRTISTIFVPFITAMFLLQDCGKGWTEYWTECDAEHRQQFDYHNNDGDIWLTPQQVCSPVSFANITWNKCLRSFVTTWSFVITQKIIYMIFMPIFMVLFKQIQNKVYVKFGIFKNKYSHKNIVFDFEYIMILTKCESMIIFGPIAPVIIPLTICSVNSNYYFYRKVIEKHDWRIKPFDYEIVYPIYFLWISMLISQMFISFIVFVYVQNITIGYVLTAILLVIDIVFIVYYVQFKKKVGSKVDIQGINSYNQK